VIGQSGKWRSGTGAAKIQSKSAYATIDKPASDPLHIAALMGAPKTVNQHRRWVAVAPLGWTIVMQDELIAIVEANSMLTSSIRIDSARQIGSGQRLRMATAK
jgi:hypothetical protein